MAFWGKGAGQSTPPGTSNLIQTADIGRKLRARLGLLEKNPTPTISSEVVPVILVDDVIAESDILVPRIRPASAWCQLVLAGASGQCRLANKTGSNVLVHVQYLIVSITAASEVTLRSHSVQEVDTPAQKGYRNTLLSNQAPSVLVGSSSAIDTTGAALAQFRLGISNLALIPFDHLMDPGRALSVGCETNVTATLDVTFVFTEESVER